MTFVDRSSGDASQKAVELTTQPSGQNEADKRTKRKSSKASGSAKTEPGVTKSESVKEPRAREVNAGSASAPATKAKWLPSLDDKQAKAVQKLGELFKLAAYESLSDKKKQAVLTYLGIHLDRIDDVISAFQKNKKNVLNAQLDLVQQESARFTKLKSNDARNKVKAAIAQIETEVSRYSNGFSSADFQGWLSKQKSELRRAYTDYFNDYVRNAAIFNRQPLKAADQIELLGREPTPQQIVDALKGLAPAEQQRLLDHFIAKYLHESFFKIDALADFVQKKTKVDDAVRLAVAENLMRHAIRTLNSAQARAFALDFLHIMQNDTPGLAQLIAPLPAEDGLRLALDVGCQLLPDTILTPHSVDKPDGLVDDHPSINDLKILSDARNQILVALNSIATTEKNRETINAMVFGIRDTTSPLDVLQRTPQLGRNLAFALAKEHDPKQPAKWAAWMSQIEGLLTNELGASWLLAGSVPERKAAALEATFYAGMNKELFENRHANLKHTLAAAMAHVLVDNTLDDFGKKISHPEEAEPRLADILENTALAQAIFNPEVPPESRRVLLCMVLEHKEIDTKAIEAVDDPWELVAKHVAELKGGIDPDILSQTVEGHAAELLIGLALGETPKPPAGVDLEPTDVGAIEKAAREGGLTKIFANLPKVFKENNVFEKNKSVEEALAALRAMADPNGPLEIGVKHISCFGGEFGRGKAVLFSVRTGRKADGTPIYAYLDSALNSYTDHDIVTKVVGRSGVVISTNKTHVSAFEDWRTTNKLEGVMVYRDDAGNLVVEKTPEARSHRKTAHSVAEGLSAATMYAGIIFPEAGIPALIIAGVGAASGLYLGIEEYLELSWLKDHGGSLTSKEALRHWLGGVTNTIGAIPFVGSLPRNLLKLRQEEEIFRAANAWRGMSRSGKAMANALAKRGIHLVSLPPQNAFIKLLLTKKWAQRTVSIGAQVGHAAGMGQMALSGVQTVVQTVDAYDDWDMLTVKQKWDFLFGLFQFAHSLKGMIPERGKTDPDLKPPPLPKMKVEKIGKTGEKNSPPPAAKPKKKDKTREAAPLPTARIVPSKKTGKKWQPKAKRPGPEVPIEEPPNMRPRPPVQHDVPWTGLNKDFVNALPALLDPSDAALIERELANWVKAYTERTGKPPELVDVMLAVVVIAEHHGINGRLIDELKAHLKFSDIVRDAINEAERKGDDPTVIEELKRLYKETSASERDITPQNPVSPQDPTTHSPPPIENGHAPPDAGQPTANPPTTPEEHRATRAQNAGERHEPLRQTHPPASPQEPAVAAAAAAAAAAVATLAATTANAAAQTGSAGSGGGAAPVGPTQPVMMGNKPPGGTPVTPVTPTTTAPAPAPGGAPSTPVARPAARGTESPPMSSASTNPPSPQPAEAQALPPLQAASAAPPGPSPNALPMRPSGVSEGAEDGSALQEPNATHDAHAKTEPTHFPLPESLTALGSIPEQQLREFFNGLSPDQQLEFVRWLFRDYPGDPSSAMQSFCERMGLASSPKSAALPLPESLAAIAITKQQLYELLTHLTPEQRLEFVYSLFSAEGMIGLGAVPDQVDDLIWAMHQSFQASSEFGTFSPTIEKTVRAWVVSETIAGRQPSVKDVSAKIVEVASKQQIGGAAADKLKSDMNFAAHVLSVRRLNDPEAYNWLLLVISPTLPQIPATPESQQHAESEPATPTQQSAFGPADLWTPIPGSSEPPHAAGPAQTPPTPPPATQPAFRPPSTPSAPGGPHMAPPPGGPATTGPTVQPAASASKPLAATPPAFTPAPGGPSTPPPAFIPPTAHPPPTAAPITPDDTDELPDGAGGASAGQPNDAPQAEESHDSVTFGQRDPAIEQRLNKLRELVRDPDWRQREKLIRYLIDEQGLTPSQRSELLHIILRDPELMVEVLMSRLNDPSLTSTERTKIIESGLDDPNLTGLQRIEFIANALNWAYERNDTVYKQLERALERAYDALLHSGRLSPEEKIAFRDAAKYLYTSENAPGSYFHASAQLAFATPETPAPTPPAHATPHTGEPAATHPGAAAAPHFPNPAPVGYTLPGGGLAVGGLYPHTIPVASHPEPVTTSGPAAPAAGPVGTKATAASAEATPNGNASSPPADEPAAAKPPTDEIPVLSGEKIAELRRQIENLNTKIGELDRQINKVNADLKAVDQQLNRPVLLPGEHQRLTQRREALNQNLGQLIRERGTLRKQRHTCNEQLPSQSRVTIPETGAGDARGQLPPNDKVDQTLGAYPHTGVLSQQKLQELEQRWTELSSIKDVKEIPDAALDTFYAELDQLSHTTLTPEQRKEIDGLKAKAGELVGKKHGNGLSSPGDRGKKIERHDDPPTTQRSQWVGESQGLIDRTREFLRGQDIPENEIDQLIQEAATWADQETPTAQQIADKLADLASKHAATKHARARKLNDLQTQRLTIELRGALKAQLSQPNLPPTPGPAPSTPEGGPAPETPPTQPPTASGPSPGHGGQPAKAQGAPKVNLGKPGVNDNTVPDAEENRRRLAVGDDRPGTFVSTGSVSAGAHTSGHTTVASAPSDSGGPKKSGGASGQPRTGTVKPAEDAQSRPRTPSEPAPPSAEHPAISNSASRLAEQDCVDFLDFIYKSNVGRTLLASARAKLGGNANARELVEWIRRNESFQKETCRPFRNYYERLIAAQETAEQDPSSGEYQNNANPSEDTTTHPNTSGEKPAAPAEHPIIPDNAARLAEQDFYDFLNTRRFGRKLLADARKAKGENADVYELMEWLLAGDKYNLAFNDDYSELRRKYWELLVRRREEAQRQWESQHANAKPSKDTAHPTTPGERTSPNEHPGLSPEQEFVNELNKSDAGRKLLVKARTELEPNAKARDILEWLYSKYLKDPTDLKHLDIIRQYWNLKNLGAPPSPEQIFLNWLNAHYPGKLEAIRPELGLGTGGTAAFRDQATSAASKLENNIENIIATIGNQVKTGNDLTIYREVCEQYFDLINARSQELLLLRGKASNAGIPLHPPADFGFKAWLEQHYPNLTQRMRDETGTYDADIMMRWLAVQTKYKIGVQERYLEIFQQRYQEIFREYLNLNARRLEELQDLKTELSSRPPKADPAPSGPVTPDRADSGTQVTNPSTGTATSHSAKNTGHAEHPDTPAQVTHNPGSVPQVKPDTNPSAQPPSAPPPPAATAAGTSRPGTQPPATTIPSAPPHPAIIPPAPSRRPTTAPLRPNTAPPAPAPRPSTAPGAQPTATASGTPRPGTNRNTKPTAQIQPVAGGSAPQPAPASPSSPSPTDTSPGKGTPNSATGEASGKSGPVNTNVIDRNRYKERHTRDTAPQTMSGGSTPQPPSAPANPTGASQGTGQANTAPPVPPQQPTTARSRARTEGKGAPLATTNKQPSGTAPADDSASVKSEGPVEPFVAAKERRTRTNYAAVVLIGRLGSVLKGVRQPEKTYNFLEKLKQSLRPEQSVGDFLNQVHQVATEQFRDKTIADLLCNAMKRDVVEDDGKSHDSGLRETDILSGVKLGPLLKRLSASFKSDGGGPSDPSSGGGPAGAPPSSSPPVGPAGGESPGAASAGGKETAGTSPLQQQQALQRQQLEEQQQQQKLQQQQQNEPLPPQLQQASQGPRKPGDTNGGDNGGASGGGSENAGANGGDGGKKAGEGQQPASPETPTGGQSPAPANKDEPGKAKAEEPAGARPAKTTEKTFSPDSEEVSGLKKSLSTQIKEISILINGILINGIKKGKFKTALKNALNLLKQADEILSHGPIAEHGLAQIEALQEDIGFLTLYEEEESFEEALEINEEDIFDAADERLNELIQTDLPQRLRAYAILRGWSNDGRPLSALETIDEMIEERVKHGSRPDKDSDIAKLESLRALIKEIAPEGPTDDGGAASGGTPGAPPAPPGSPPPAPPTGGSPGPGPTAAESPPAGGPSPSLSPTGGSTEPATTGAAGGKANNAADTAGGSTTVGGATSSSTLSSQTSAPSSAAKPQSPTAADHSKGAEPSSAPEPEEPAPGAAVARPLDRLLVAKVNNLARIAREAATELEARRSSSLSTENRAFTRAFNKASEAKKALKNEIDQLKKAVLKGTVSKAGAQSLLDLLNQALKQVEDQLDPPTPPPATPAPDPRPPEKPAKMAEPDEPGPAPFGGRFLRPQNTKALIGGLRSFVANLAKVAQFETALRKWLKARQGRLRENQYTTIETNYFLEEVVRPAAINAFGKPVADKLLVQMHKQLAELRSNEGLSELPELKDVLPINLLIDQFFSANDFAAAIRNNIHNPEIVTDLVNVLRMNAKRQIAAKKIVHMSVNEILDNIQTIAKQRIGEAKAEQLIENLAKYMDGVSDDTLIPPEELAQLLSQGTQPPQPPPSSGAPGEGPGGAAPAGGAPSGSGSAGGRTTSADHGVAAPPSTAAQHQDPRAAASQGGSSGAGGVPPGAPPPPPSDGGHNGDGGDNGNGGGDGNRAPQVSDKKTTEKEGSAPGEPKPELTDAALKKLASQLWEGERPSLDSLSVADLIELRRLIETRPMKSDEFRRREPLLTIIERALRERQQAQAREGHKKPTDGEHAAKASPEPDTSVVELDLGPTEDLRQSLFDHAKKRLSNHVEKIKALLGKVQNTMFREALENALKLAEKAQGRLSQKHVTEQDLAEAESLDGDFLELTRLEDHKFSGILEANEDRILQAGHGAPESDLTGIVRLYSLMRGWNENGRPLSPHETIEKMIAERMSWDTRTDPMTASEIADLEHVQDLLNSRSSASRSAPGGGTSAGDSPSPGGPAAESPSKLTPAQLNELATQLLKQYEGGQQPSLRTLSPENLRNLFALLATEMLKLIKQGAPIPQRFKYEDLLWDIKRELATRPGEQQGPPENDPLEKLFNEVRAAIEAAKPGIPRHDDKQPASAPPARPDEPPIHSDTPPLEPTSASPAETAQPTLPPNDPEVWKAAQGLVNHVNKIGGALGTIENIYLQDAVANALNMAQAAHERLLQGAVTEHDLAEAKLLNVDILKLMTFVELVKHSGKDVSEIFTNADNKILNAGRGSRETNLLGFVRFYGLMRSWNNHGRPLSAHETIERMITERGGRSNKKMASEVKALEKVSALIPLVEKAEETQIKLEEATKRLQEARDKFNEAEARDRPAQELVDATDEFKKAQSANDTAQAAYDAALKPPGGEVPVPIEVSPVSSEAQARAQERDRLYASCLEAEEKYNQALGQIETALTDDEITKAKDALEVADREYTAALDALDDFAKIMKNGQLAKALSDARLLLTEARRQYWEALSNHGPHDKVTKSAEQNYKQALQVERKAALDYYEAAKPGSFDNDLANLALQVSAAKKAYDMAPDNDPAKAQLKAQYEVASKAYQEAVRQRWPEYAPDVRPTETTTVSPTTRALYKLTQQIQGLENRRHQLTKELNREDLNAIVKAEIKAASAEKALTANPNDHQTIAAIEKLNDQIEELLKYQGLNPEQRLREIGDTRTGIEAIVHDILTERSTFHSELKNLETALESYETMTGIALLKPFETEATQPIENISRMLDTVIRDLEAIRRNEASSPKEVESSKDSIRELRLLQGLLAKLGPS
jgi:hypothetical protein